MHSAGLLPTAAGGRRTTAPAVGHRRRHGAPTQQLRSSVGQSSSLVTGAYSCRMGRRACRGKRFTRRRLERRNSDHRGRRALYDRDHIRNGTTHIAKRVAGRGLDMCRTIEHVDARSRLRKPAHRRIARSDRLLTVLSDPHVYGRPNRFRTQRVQRQRPLDGSRCRHNGSFQRRGLFLRTYTLPSTERSGRHDQPKLGRLHGSSLVQPGTAHAVPGNRHNDEYAEQIAPTHPLSLAQCHVSSCRRLRRTGRHLVSGRIQRRSL